MGRRWCCSNSLKSNVEPVLYKSVVAYDGTQFHGYQRQSEANRTVQAVLESALRGIGWSGESVRGAGRTDAGAHARGQVVAYRLAWNGMPEQLTAALNANLPPDLAVLSSEPALEGFDPRFSASGRRYSYRVIASAIPNPFAERYGWRVWPPPTLERLSQLAKLFLGRRDFGGFGRAPIPGGHSIREVRRAEWAEGEDGLLFEIEADAFLNKMVRRVVGAQVQVALGRSDEARLSTAIADPSQLWNGRIAPARGLCLETVYYEERRERIAENLLSQT